MRPLLARLLSYFGRRSSDQRLDEEIEAHLALLVEQYRQRGMPPGAAREAARRAFGGVEQVKATFRDQRGLPFIDALAQDVRFAFRVLRRDRGFTLTAVLVLGLGIGVNNMLSTIIYAHTLRSLPIPGADRVLYISTLDGRVFRRGSRARVKRT